MPASIKLDVSSLVGGLDALLPFLDTEIKIALAEAALEVENQAKEVHEYTDRTQHLTQSIGGTPVSGQFLTGYSVDITAGGGEVLYAGAIEFGRPNTVIDTQSRAFWGYRFMRDALDAKEDSFNTKISEAVELAILKAGLG